MTKTEYSCGGVVIDGKKTLLIRVVNLRGKKVWTFPKGHIEPNETPVQTALREVEEETGYKCAIISPIYKVKYYFSLKGDIIKKIVQWYLMKPLGKIKHKDNAEICTVEWFSFEKCRALLSYESDIKLLSDVGEMVFPKKTFPSS